MRIIGAWLFAFSGIFLIRGITFRVLHQDRTILSQTVYAAGMATLGVVLIFMLKT